MADQEQLKSTDIFGGKPYFLTKSAGKVMAAQGAEVWSDRSSVPSYHIWDAPEVLVWLSEKTLLV